MTQSMVSSTRMTVGFDLGDRRSAVCILDGDGVVQERATISTTEQGLRTYFESRPSSRIALEAGTHSPWVSDLLRSFEHEVIVANPRKLSLISENNNKTDLVDAELLARLARVDVNLLSPIEHRGACARADLAIIRARDGVVAARTDLVNQARGLLKSSGVRVGGCSTDAFPKRAREVMTEELAPAIEPLLAAVTELSRTIKDYDRKVEELNARHEETSLLRQVPGVGALTAATYVLTIEDPHRFKTSRAVGAWLGLRPSRDQSGARDPELRISKAGDRNLRRLLVTAAHYVIGPFGPDSDLRRWGLKLAERGRKNAKKRAIVAVARKLAVLLHRLWVTGATYEPLRNNA